ncbi:MAG: hypothetical protein IJ300_14420, partial [Clostridia bacterium]|nr:hypothetical protein [Clostridia bacterium]
MKNTIKLISLSVLFLLVFASCTNKGNDIKETVKTQEQVIEQDVETAIVKTEEQEDVPQAIGGYSELNRRFIDPVYDIHYVIDLRGDVVYDWADKLYKEMSREEVLSLPDLYRAIKAFDVTKEELISVKDPKLTLEIIDALYLEEEEMKKALASDLSLVYDGDVYCYYDIMGLWGDETAEASMNSINNA